MHNELNNRIEALEREVKESRRRNEEMDREITGLRNSYWEERKAHLAAEAESAGWKRAFAAQTRKLQSVLHIDGVKSQLASLDHEKMEVEEASIISRLEADKARLSEALIGLCDWIENEVGAELPFDARAALAGSGSGWRGIYRLLETTDTIQAGDEVIDDDGVTWCPVDRWSIGCEVSRLFKSIRRALPAAPQQGGE